MMTEARRQVKRGVVGDLAFQEENR